MTNRATTAQAEDTFASMLKGAEAPEAEKLLDLFSQLATVSVDSMIGLWRVAAFGRSPRDPIAVPPDPGPLPQRESLGMRKLSVTDAQSCLCR